MDTHLSEPELARRWNVSRRSLQRWRAEGTGPAYLRLNGRVVYALQDIAAFEAMARVPATSTERPQT
jgi:predicted site-specific integrase-resolvase